MHSKGVTVAYNSDDAEMSRRLNQAAKAVKYGGVSEEDAWKFVPLTWKLLHIDDEVGIESGKIGRPCVWSDHPMSIYAVWKNHDWRCSTMNWTGRGWRIRKERNQLIQQMLSAKNGVHQLKAPKTSPWIPLWNFRLVLWKDIVYP